MSKLGKIYQLAKTASMQNGKSSLCIVFDPIAKVDENCHFVESLGIQIDTFCFFSTALRFPGAYGEFHYHTTIDHSEAFIPIKPNSEVVFNLPIAKSIFSCRTRQLHTEQL